MAALRSAIAFRMAGVSVAGCDNASCSAIQAFMSAKSIRSRMGAILGISVVLANSDFDDRLRFREDAGEVKSGDVRLIK